MPIVFELGKHVRCDIVAWGGVGFSGKRGVVRVFPAGNIQGSLEPADMNAVVIRAFHGTRVILATRPEGDFEEGPWRCVRVLPGHSLAAEKDVGLPGVRIPDLDRLDAHSARRTATDLEQSYPLVRRFEEGEGWTFGTVGFPELKGHVRRIIIEKDDAPRARPLTEGERVARAVLARAREVAPEAVDALLAAAGEELGTREHDALKAWLDE
ncbi:MAG: hypothetical protein ABIO70_06195 [Pseudomonadota bacterium]